VPTLYVYTSRHCDVCRYAWALAAAAERFPEMDVRVVDVDGGDAEVPEEVFALPTYVLDGRVVSVGNPDLNTVERALADVTGSGADE
jgi:hypothetical protein